MNIAEERLERVQNTTHGWRAQLTIAGRSLKTAAWLGWQIESNWTDPFLFAVYSFIKPIAGAAILVVMYSVITDGAFSDPTFAYIYLGYTFYIYVGAVMTGVSWAVIEDREHYKTLKYIYIAPIRIPFYLIGRGFARFLTGSIAVGITLAAGVLFLNLPLDPATIQWGSFVGALVLGILMLAMMGLLLAGVTLIIANHVWYIGDTVSGALFLFSGAIFPLEVLPAWLRWIGYLNPITYWLELIRRSLAGSVAAAFPTFSQLSDQQLFAILFFLTIAFSVLAARLFRWFDFQARERGMIDMVTNY